MMERKDRVNLNCCLKGVYSNDCSKEQYNRASASTLRLGGSRQSDGNRFGGVGAHSISSQGSVLLCLSLSHAAFFLLVGISDQYTATF